MSELAEKVRFWKEQQEINDLLIPRVVEGAKALEAAVAQISALTSQAVEQKVALEAATREIRDLETRVGRTSTLAVGATLCAVVSTVVSVLSFFVGGG